MSASVLRTSLTEGLCVSTPVPRGVAIAGRYREKARFSSLTRTYSLTANTAASLLTKGRRSSGHWERHSVRCSASDSFVPAEPRFKDVTASHARGSASKRGRRWMAIIVLFAAFNAPLSGKKKAPKMVNLINKRDKNMKMQKDRSCSVLRPYN